MSIARAPSWPRQAPTGSPDVEHRRLVALAFADHHPAVDLDLVQRRPHGLDRHVVGMHLVAVAHGLGGGDRRPFGDADEILLDGQVDGHAGLLLRKS